jgi:hypothetical protein
VEKFVISSIVSTRLSQRLAAVAVLAAIGAGDPAARAEADANIDTAQRIIALAPLDTRDGTLVRITLKSLKDPALAPLFKKLRESKSENTRLDAMLALAISTKDTTQLDVKELLGIGDDQRIGAAIAQLIENETITNDQLKVVMDRENLDPGHRMLAASELSRRKALADHAILTRTLEREAGNANRYDIVRHYAAITLLESENAEENKAALKALMEMFEPRDRRLEQVQELMLYRVFKNKLKLAAPWVRAIAQDFNPNGDEEGHVSPRLAMTAMATLLALNDPEGPKVLEQMIAVRREISDQLTLGLTAIEFADRLTPKAVAKLGERKLSKLVIAVSDTAKMAVEKKGEGKEVSDAVLALVQDGQPIVLNWALGYSATAPKDRQVTMRVALVNKSSILDDARETAYERAAIAANRLIEENGEEGRKEIAAILKGNNRGATEAALLGMMRATNAKDLSSLIDAKNYQDWCKSSAMEYSANYATLILAREGKQEARDWLGGMLTNVQNAGTRSVAAWYYVKLKGQEKAVLDKVVAEAK